MTLPEEWESQTVRVRQSYPRSWLSCKSVVLRWFAAAVAVTLAPAAMATSARLRPPVPSQVTARLTDTELIVTYCFRAPLPKDPHQHPAILTVGLDNAADSRPPYGRDWPIRQRCGRVRQPRGRIRKPYVVRITVSAPAGNVSRLLNVKPKGA